MAMPLHVELPRTQPVLHFARYLEVGAWRVWCPWSSRREAGDSVRMAGRAQWHRRDVCVASSCFEMKFVDKDTGV